MVRYSVARNAVRGMGLLMATVGSAYLFWAASFCERERVDLVASPAGPVTFSAELDIPSPQGSFPPRSTLFQQFAAEIHPYRILWPLNAWFHGEACDDFRIPARIPWVRLTVRGMLALSCLLTAILAARMGWIGWQFSLKSMFVLLTFSAVAIWAHGQLSEWQQLQANRDLAWAVGMATTGGAIGSWLAGAWSSRPSIRERNENIAPRQLAWREPKIDR